MRWCEKSERSESGDRKEEMGLGLGILSFMGDTVLVL